MHRGVGLLAVVVAAAALLAARPAHGQPAGSVQGTVVDEGGGAPLAAAVVTLEELGLSITTGPDGTFSIDDVPAGNYRLTVTREGFAPLTSRVTVTAGVPVHLDLRLPVGEFEERVEVTGVRSELALAEESDSGSRLGLRAIDIPASIDVIASAVMETRGYQRLSDAVETMPGVTAGHNPAAPSSFSVRGPASVLNGQGAVAGTINAITKQAAPTAATEWNGLLTYGRFNTYQTAIGVNGPISDSLWYRFDVSRYGSDGYVDRMSPSSSNVTGSLLWRPSPRANLRFSVDYLDDAAGSYFGTPLLPVGAVADPLDVITTTTGEGLDARTPRCA